MQEKRALAKNSYHFLSGTLISRLSGLLRDISMAYAFGVTKELAAFMVAFRFANVARRLFGESALSSSFIPHFEKVRVSGNQQALFFRDFFFSLLFVLLLFVAAAEALTYFFFDSEITLYMRLMLPGLIFISLYGLTSSLMNCEKRFFLPALAPIGFNCVWIISALLLKGKDQAFTWLSYSVTLAFFAQLLMTLPFAWRWLKKELPKAHLFRFQLFSKEVKKAVKPFFLGFLGLGAMQLNMFFDALFARVSDPMGPAYLWYAIRLQQVPLALFGVALSTALLPSLSRAYKEGDEAKGERLLTYALSRAFAFLFPATIGLSLVGEKAIDLLFGHGHFGGESVALTSQCLVGYALALVPAGWALLIGPLFYAKGDYKTPLVGVLISVSVNVAFNSFFIFYLGWGAESIAYATSFSALIQFFFLHYCWGGEIKLKALFRIAACAALALGTAFRGNIFWQTSIFCGTYLISAWTMKAEEILDLVPFKWPRRR